MNNYCGSKAPPPGRGYGAPSYCFRKGFGAGYNSALSAQQAAPSQFQQGGQAGVSIEQLKAQNYSVNKNKNRFIVRKGRGRDRQTIGRADTEAAAWALARSNFIG
jgi:hypothetical protein